MDTTDVGTTPSHPPDISSCISAIRQIVLQQWVVCVREKIPEAEHLAEKVLTNALPRFFDEIVRALKSGRPYFIETSGISSISSHGRDRANSTSYGPKELLQELQLFRQTFFEVADANNITLNHQHRAIIARSIDTATQEAIATFAIAHREIGENFIACLSHDLRNPLNVANVAAQLIQLKSDDERVLVLAKRIRDKISNIDEMIQTLLDAAVLNGRKKLRLKIISFNMKALTDEVSADMSSPEQPIISTGEPVVGFWCLSSMKRVIENLLSNAKKYGDSSELIEIHIAKYEDKINLRVHNKGPAIPKQELHRLFGTFHRIEDVDIKGWGLGLPFVQLVAESHGGSVFVESTPVDGTTFTVQLPIDCRAFDSASK